MKKTDGVEFSRCFVCCSISAAGSQLTSGRWRFRLGTLRKDRPLVRPRRGVHQVPPWGPVVTRGEHGRVRPFPELVRPAEPACLLRDPLRTYRPTAGCTSAAKRICKLSVSSLGLYEQDKSVNRASIKRMSGIQKAGVRTDGISATKSEWERRIARLHETFSAGGARNYLMPSVFRTDGISATKKRMGTTHRTPSRNLFSRRCKKLSGRTAAVVC